MFQKKTLNDIDIDGKRVLLRADYNVPIKDGVIQSDFRIQQSIPTIKALQEKGCKIVIISHLGRPKGKAEPQFSLKPVAKSLSKLLGSKVTFISDCIGDSVRSAAQKLQTGEVLLLENLRFYEGEEKNDDEFAEQLLQSAVPDIFVQTSLRDS